MMLYPGFIARDAVLETCPDLNCRRAQTCRRAAGAVPCQRSHERLDDFHAALAAKLNRLMLELGVPPDEIGRERVRDHAMEVKLAAFKLLLEEAEAADQAAAAVPRRLTAEV